MYGTQLNKGSPSPWAMRMLYKESISDFSIARPQCHHTAELERPRKGHSALSFFVIEELRMKPVQRNHCVSYHDKYRAADHFRFHHEPIRRSSCNSTERGINSLGTEA